MSHRLAQRLAAEAVGTAFLVAAVVGSGIMAQRLTDDPALALLANTIATGAALVVLISILAPISGAHLNPAVTLVSVISRRVSALHGTGYVVAQVAGGIVGSILAHAMFAEPLLQLSAQRREGMSFALSEAVAAFGLLTVILLATRQRSAQVPLLVGLYIVAAYWFTASTSFANLL